MQQGLVKKKVVFGRGKELIRDLKRIYSGRNLVRVLIVDCCGHLPTMPWFFVIVVNQSSQSVWARNFTVYCSAEDVTQIAFDV